MVLMEMYDIIFICYSADYYWTVEEGLGYKEAEYKLKQYDRKDKAHGNNGCCHYLIQKKE